MADFQRIAPGPAEGASAPSENCCSSFLRAVSKFLDPTVTVGRRSVRVGRVLGEGGFSFVHEAVDVSTAEKFALKRIVCQTGEQLDLAKQEVRVHERLGSHPNILPIVEYAVIPSHVGGEARDAAMLLPLARGGSLATLIER
jgi:serine/threonine kinase 16